MTAYTPIRYARIIGLRQDVILPEPVYNGPGDIVSGAMMWWGLRAYSSATRGTNCCRIRRASDNAEQDFTTLQNGNVDRSAISTFLTSTTGFFTKLYDQSGNSRDLIQATAGSQLAVNLSGIGSKVTIDGSASKLMDTSTSQTQNFPLTHVAGIKSISIGSQQSVL